MRKAVLRVILPALAVVFALSFPIRALINPNFTPLELVDQGKFIALVKVGTAKDGKVPIEVIRVMKGKKPTAKLAFDLSTCPLKAHIETVEKMLKANGDTPTILFVGPFEEGEGGEGGGEFIDEGEMEGEGEEEEGPTKVFLNILGKWLAFAPNEKNANLYEFESINTHLLATWNGGTDMFTKEIDYIVKNPEDATCPVNAGTEWDEEIKLGKATGKVTDIMAVDLKGTGVMSVYVAAESGDHLYVYDAKKGAFANQAAAVGLAAKSKASSWGDFNGDGTLDLVSWDGAKLTLLAQGKDGKFAAKEAKFSAKLPADVLSFDTMAVGEKGKAGLVVSTKAAPVVAASSADGSSFEVKVLTGPAMDKKAGPAGKCLVSDFSGDGVCDIIQPFGWGGILYKAEKPGVIGKGEKCENGLGKGASDSYIGDWDHDGLMDVFAVSESGCLLWHNRGNCKFEQTMGLTGEPSYIAQPGGTGGCTSDFNNDGRQDFLILYMGDPKIEGSGGRPLFFFNRGWRSFGHGHQIDLQEQEILPEALKGQQAGTLADFNGDGAEEFVFAMMNGEIWMLTQDVGDDPALGVKVVLPLDAGNAGPVMVTGWNDKYCMGTWAVTAGGRSGFYGYQDADEKCKLKWKFPGGKEQTAELKITEKPMTFVLKPTGGSQKKSQ